VVINTTSSHEKKKVATKKGGNCSEGAKVRVKRGNNSFTRRRATENIKGAQAKLPPFKRHRVI